jgi:hypothetical protein
VLWLSSNQIFSHREFSQTDFFVPSSSANQVISPLDWRSIRFFRLRVQSIRFFLAERSANECSWGLGEGGVNRSGFSREEHQAIRFFQTEKSISQLISISGRYETKNPLQAEERIWWVINGSVVSFEIGGSTRQRPAVSGAPERRRRASRRFLERFTEHVH